MFPHMFYVQITTMVHLTCNCIFVEILFILAFSESVTVNLKNQGLTDVPTDLFSNTTELNLG